LSEMEDYFTCIAPACSTYKKKVCQKCLEEDGVKFKFVRADSRKVFLDGFGETKGCATGVTCPACGRGRLRKWAGD
jgi:hypothetical protein